MAAVAFLLLWLGLTGGFVLLWVLAEWAWESIELYHGLDANDSNSVRIWTDAELERLFAPDDNEPTTIEDLALLNG
jgi:hypothetical protein